MKITTPQDYLRSKEDMVYKTKADLMKENDNLRYWYGYLEHRAEGYHRHFTIEQVVDDIKDILGRMKVDMLGNRTSF